MNRLRRQRILLVTLGTLWSGLWPVLPDLAIYWTLGNFLKPLVTINLPQSPQFLGNICKGVKIYQFSCGIISGHLYRHLAIFIWSHWLWPHHIRFNGRSEDRSPTLSSVTSKKMPNIYKSCPKIISLAKLKISTPLQKLPKNVGYLDKLVVA